MVGLQAGEHVWTAAIGFHDYRRRATGSYCCGAGEKVGGGVNLTSVRRLAKWQDSCWRPFAIWPVGPLRRVPRRCRLSRLIAPLTGDSAMPLLIWRGLFAIVILVPLYPGSCWIQWGISRRR